METMQSLKVKVFMQYVLEFLIERYEHAKMQSDRYYVELEFLDFVDTCREDTKVILDYMELQPEKFEPFIGLLKKIRTPSTPRRAASPMKVKIITFNAGDY